MKKYVESLDVGRVPVSHVESPRILSLSVPPRHCWALTLAPWPAPNQRLRWWSPAGCRGRSSSARICPRKFVFCTRWRRKLGASGLASFEGHVNFIPFEVSDGSNNFMGHAVTCDKKLYGRRTIMCWTKDLDFFCIFCPYALTPGWPTRERHIQLEDFLEVGGMLGIYQPTRFFFLNVLDQTIFRMFQPSHTLRTSGPRPQVHEKVFAGGITPELPPLAAAGARGFRDRTGKFLRDQGDLHHIHQTWTTSKAIKTCWFNRFGM